MADYTKKNLKDVKDSAVDFGLSPGLEARFARRDLESESLGLSYQRLAPGFRVPFGHKHGEQEEVYVVLSGSALLKLNDEVVELAQWDAVRVGKDTTRNFEGGPKGAEILAFGAGERGLNDAEVIQGWWSD